MRLVLLLLMFSFSALLFAQPPAGIQPQHPAALPDAPLPAALSQAQQKSDRQWRELIKGTHYTRPEIRIQASGNPMHCDVDKVTEDELFCTEHRSRGLVNLLIPRDEYHVPRHEIRDVRVYGRVMSTLIGAGIGVGLGAGLASINPANREDGGPAYFGLLFGGLGAWVGHSIPMAGHPVYQQP